MSVQIDLSGKKAVVFGVANHRSIAWAISEKLAAAGASLAFTYLNDRLKRPVEKTIAALGDPPLLLCDATDDAQVAATYEDLRRRWGNVDIVVHSVAFADRNDLGGDFSAAAQ